MKPLLKVSKKLTQMLCSALVTAGACAQGSTPSIPPQDQGFTGMLPQNPPELGTRYKDIPQFLRSIALPESFKTQIAKGDLNHDGIEDAAILIQSTPNGCSQIFILLQASHESLILNDASKTSCGSNVYSKTSIKNDSLFIYSEALRGERGTLEFRYSKMDLELINEELDESEGEDDSTFKEIQTTIDYLTGLVTFKRTNDNRTLQTHATGPKCLLREFDFDFSYCANQWKTDGRNRLSDLMYPL